MPFRRFLSFLCLTFFALFSSPVLAANDRILAVWIKVSNTRVVKARMVFSDMAAVRAYFTGTLSQGQFVGGGAGYTWYYITSGASVGSYPTTCVPPSTHPYTGNSLLGTTGVSDMIIEASTIWYDGPLFYAYDSTQFPDNYMVPDGKGGPTVVNINGTGSSDINGNGGPLNSISLNDNTGTITITGGGGGTITTDTSGTNENAYSTGYTTNSLASTGIFQADLLNSVNQVGLSIEALPHSSYGTQFLTANTYLSSIASASSTAAQKSSLANDTLSLINSKLTTANASLSTIASASGGSSGGTSVDLSPLLSEVQNFHSDVMAQSPSPTVSSIQDNVALPDQSTTGVPDADQQTQITDLQSAGNGLVALAGRDWGAYFEGLVGSPPTFGQNTVVVDTSWTITCPSLVASWLSGLGSVSSAAKGSGGTSTVVMRLKLDLATTFGPLLAACRIGCLAGLIFWFIQLCIADLKAAVSS